TRRHLRPARGDARAAGRGAGGRAKGAPLLRDRGPRLALGPRSAGTVLGGARGRARDSAGRDPRRLPADPPRRPSARLGRHRVLPAPAGQRAGRRDRGRGGHITVRLTATLSPRQTLVLLLLTSLGLGACAGMPAAPSTLSGPSPPEACVDRFSGSIA